MTNRLGIKLHPESVTAQWYTAACPPTFRPELSRADSLRWRLSRLLRWVGR